MTTFQTEELSLYLPCYNEENNVRRTFEKTVPIISKVAKKWEIILVNDGSKDRTLEVMRELCALYPDHTTIVDHHVNRGFGAAMKSGMYTSKYNWIAYIDADGQFDFSEISHLLATQKQTNADLVIGYYLGRKVPVYRKLGSALWQLAVFILFGLRVRDIDCGFKLFRKKVVTTIPKLEAERGPFITTEFLVKAIKSKFKIVEIGVHHYPRTEGEGTGAKLNVIIAGLTDLIRLWFKLKAIG